MLAPKNAHPEAWADFKAGPWEETIDVRDFIFGLSDGFWTGLQLDHDMANAREALADVLASITPHVVSQ